MDKLKHLKDLKSTRNSLGNGIFCIFDSDDGARIARDLQEEGVLEKVRWRKVQHIAKDFSYTVYKETGDEN